MAKSSDWLKPGRTEMLKMAKNWATLMAANNAKWNIPQPVVSQITVAADIADKALTEAQNEATRTPVATAQCKDTFEALAKIMRDIKRRYFLVPPLTNADLIALGLKPRDTTQTPSGTPTAQTTLETFLVGRHELGIKIIYITGSLEDAANKGYRIWHTVLSPGETPPASPEDLRKSFYTKRSKDVIEFDYNDSGKTVWMAVQIENEGKKGPWGPLVSALIP